jgi:hypothetical protein
MPFKATIVSLGRAGASAARPGPALIRLVDRGRPLMHLVACAIWHELARVRPRCLQNRRLAVRRALELVAIGYQPAPVDLIRTPRVARAWPRLPLLIRSAGEPQTGHHGVADDEELG